MVTRRSRFSGFGWFGGLVSAQSCSKYVVSHRRDFRCETEYQTEIVVIENPPNPSNPPFTPLSPSDLARLPTVRRIHSRAVALAHRRVIQDRNFRSFGRFGASIGASVRDHGRFPNVLRHFSSIAWTLTSLRSLVRVQYRPLENPMERVPFHGVFSLP